MGGLEILSTPAKYQLQDSDQKPQPSRTPAKYMETSASRATFIRQLVRTMSLEDIDILADEEVCDILSDSPDPEEDDEDEEPVKANLLQQHVNKLLEDDRTHPSSKKSTNPSYNTYFTGRHVLATSPTQCYTVDMVNGVASPIKTTSNVGISGAKGSSKLYSYAGTNRIASQGDVVQVGKRLTKDTSDTKSELASRPIGVPSRLSQGIKNIHFDDESSDDRGGSSTDEREGLDDKDLLYQGGYPVDSSPSDDDHNGDVALHNGLLPLQNADLGVHLDDLRESFSMGRPMRASDQVAMLRTPAVPHLAPPVMPTHPHMHQMDSASKPYKMPMHGSSSAYKPLSQSQPTVNSHNYTQPYSYSHVQYANSGNHNESYSNSNYNNFSGGASNYSSNNGNGAYNQSSVYQYNSQEQHFPTYQQPTPHTQQYHPHYPPMHQQHQSNYTHSQRTPVNSGNTFNVQQGAGAYPSNMYGYNNYNVQPKQPPYNIHTPIQPPQPHRQPPQHHHQQHPHQHQHQQHQHQHQLHHPVQPYTPLSVSQAQQDKSRPLLLPTSTFQPRLALHAVPPVVQQPFHTPAAAASHFAPLQLAVQQQPEHDHPTGSEGYEGYSSGSDGIEGGDEAKGSKRSELVESPTTKQTYKQFFKQFKATEKEGLSAAKEFAEQNLELLPLKVHWKVYLELADLAKRENSLKLARKFYRKVIKLQPYASQGWLEYAKMEEECGQLDKCAEILTNGLHYCPYNESLMVKGIKHEERMGNLAAARSLLSRLRTQSIDKAWRTIMEGGLLEARAGNISVARKIFKYLIKNVPWYGPIYQEAYRFEEKCEEYDRAIAIVEKGLKENPRYGPLWFSALRLYEKTSNGNLTTTRSVVERAAQSISKELMWKIYFEAAQIEERAGNLDMSRAAYVKSVEHCPENLLWKVWLGGSRTELDHDNVTVARKLLSRSLQEVPAKMKAMVLLECSRLEEFAGNIDKARRILQKAKQEAKHEWKVFLESVLLEMRANNIDGAIAEAKEALKIHSGTGRLWAVLIQLKQGKGQGFREQLKVFQRALREVPKSGEVWCEGARIALNNNEIGEARRFLDFAIQFTPQYGDSFIEYMRLELMQHGENADTTKLEQSCVNADPNYGTMWLHSKKHPLDSTRQVLRNAKRLLVESSSPAPPPSDLADPEKWDGCWIGSVGILSLSRVNRNTSELTNEERRKLIFGSDQIKP